MPPLPTGQELFFLSLLLPLASNISAVQSIVLDRQLLELELGHLVTDNTACLFNFLLLQWHRSEVSPYKSLWMPPSYILSAAAK